MKNSDSTQISIIGGGVIGLATALFLQKKGYEVTLFDEETDNSKASLATAGIIGGSTVIPWAGRQLWKTLLSSLIRTDSHFLVKWPLPTNIFTFFNKSYSAGANRSFMDSATGLASLGLIGLQSWMELLDDCAKGRLLFQKSGCYLLNNAPSKQSAEDKNNDLRRNLGMDVKSIDPNELKKLIPVLKLNMVGGSLVTGAAHVCDVVELQIILRDLFYKKGGNIKFEKIIDFGTDGRNVYGIKTISKIGAKKIWKVEKLVIAAGFGSAALTRKLGTIIPLLSGRGGSIVLHNPDIELNSPVLWLNEGVAIVPVKQGIRVSGLLEIGGKNTSNHNRLEKILKNKVKLILGNFKYRKLTSSFGIRPLTPDSLPIIDRVSNFDNVFCNFGHGHWGVTQAASSANFLERLMSSEEFCTKRNQFSIKRF